MSVRAPLFRNLRTTRSTIRQLPRISQCHYSQLPVRDIRARTSSQNRQLVRYRMPYSIPVIRSFSRSTSLQATEDRNASSRIDQVMEQITELYGSATDEFEIAAEETEKNTTYAPEDRAAAREEVDKLLALYKSVEEGSDREVAEAIKKRVGGKVKELEQAMLGLEESAKNHD